MDKKAKPRYGIYQNVVFLAKDILHCYPLLIAFLLLETVLAVITPILGMLIPKIAMDLVEQNASRMQTLLALGGAGGLMAVLMAFSGMAGRGKYFMYNGMRNYYRTSLFLQSLVCDYAHIESTEGQARYSRARSTLSGGEGSGTSRLTVATVDFLTAVLGFCVFRHDFPA